jgi:hypothetical protein
MFDGSENPVPHHPYLTSSHILPKSIIGESNGIRGLVIGILTLQKKFNRTIAEVRVV